MPENPYLTMGRRDDGDLIGISDCVSGKCDLVCPFCKTPLIAVKGNTKQHHFRHDGETCLESLAELPQIPGWHHFHLNYPLAVVEALRAGQAIPAKYQDTLQRKDSFTGLVILTDTAKVILGSLSLPKFNSWFRSILGERVSSVREAIDDGEKHPAWLEIEASRQQSILKSTLYLFGFETECGLKIQKIGRTIRPVEDRLKEVSADLSANGYEINKGSVLRVVENGGCTEQYALYRYSEYRFQMGSHREYISLNDKQLSELKKAFTLLAKGNEPFNKAERFVVSGRWRYEKKRIEAVRGGIRKALDNKMAFGRPKGTALDQKEWLAKHSDAVALLNQGRQVAVVAGLTGKSASTIKRVKKSMSENTVQHEKN